MGFFFIFFIALGAIFGKRSLNSVRYVAKLPASSSISACAEHSFRAPLPARLGITWPDGNPTKCPQQRESHYGSCADYE